MSPLLAFENVDAGYGGARILHGLSLAIGPNESVAILGRNGVGKTTFVKTFLGIATRFAGSLRFSGQKRDAPRYFDASRAGVSVVPQGRAIFANLSVRENLLLGASSGRKGRWTLDGVMELFPILRERATNPGTALSGGQQQMLAIGRALMANPVLLVLDEPSEGLAPVIVDELAAVLRNLAAEGTSLLLIEQNFALISRVADRYCVMSKGAIVEEGRAAELSIESLKKHVSI